MIVLETLALGAVMAGALWYVGYGVTHLALPPPLHAARWWFMPFFGMALIIVWSYIALFFHIELTTATRLLIVAATVVNGVVVIGRWREGEKERKSEPGFGRRMIDSVYRTLRIGSQSHAFGTWRAIVIVAAMVVFVAAVAPLWRYGYVTVIGENWDYEFYLPLADYLRAMPTAALASAPANPLLTTILSRHILPLPMGFSYLQASLDALTGREALDSFAVLLALLRALAVVAAYLFLRYALRLSERVAVVGTVLLAANGMLLWFTYWNFGLHLASLALLPVVLVFGVGALMEGGRTTEDDRRPTTDERRTTNATLRPWSSVFRRSFFVLCAGLMLSALNVTYHPALVAAGLALGVLFVILFVTTHDRVRLLARGAALAALTVAFSSPALAHIDDFVREYYGRTPLAIGLREFVPLSDGYGLSLDILQLAVGHTIPTQWLYDLIAQGWDLLAPALTLFAVALSLYALWDVRHDRTRRVVWYALVGASVFYIALSRLPFLRPYPYGFLKGLSLVSYLLIPLAVQGFFVLGRRLQAAAIKAPSPPAWANKGMWVKIARGALYAGGAVAVAVIGVTFALAVEQYFKPAPPFFNANALGVRTLTTIFRNQPRATVLLTERVQAQGIPMGLLAYALREAELRGNVTTGYGSLNNAERGAVYDYALLTPGESATARGYDEHALWQNDSFALYPRAPEILVYQELWQPLPENDVTTLTLDQNGASPTERALDSTAVARSVTLGLVTLAPTEMTLKLGEQETTLELAFGLTTYTFLPVNLPTMLVLTNANGESAWLSFVRYTESRQETQVEAVRALVVQCRGSQASLDADCAVANGGERNLTWKWIVRGTLAGTREERVVAQGEANGSPRGDVRFEVDERGALREIVFDGAAQSVTTPPLPDGKWRADVEVWDGTTLLARFDVHPLITVDGDRMIWSEGGGTPVVIE